MEKSCGTIIIKNNKVLMVHQNIGHWSFPKGHVENNETEYETAIRETYEETGIKVKIIDNSPRYQISYHVNNNLKEVIYFLAEVIDDKNLRPQEGEIKEVSWIELNEVNNLLKYENARILWDKVLKDLKK